MAHAANHRWSEAVLLLTDAVLTRRLRRHTSYAFEKRASPREREREKERWRLWFCALNARTRQVAIEPAGGTAERRSQTTSLSTSLATRSPDERIGGAHPFSLGETFERCVSRRATP